MKGKHDGAGPKIKSEISTSSGPREIRRAAAGHVRNEANQELPKYPCWGDWVANWKAQALARILDQEWLCPAVITDPP